MNGSRLSTSRGPRRKGCSRSGRWGTLLSTVTPETHGPPTTVLLHFLSLFYVSPKILFPTPGQRHNGIECSLSASTGLLSTLEMVIDVPLDPFAVSTLRFSGGTESCVCLDARTIR